MSVEEAKKIVLKGCPGAYASLWSGLWRIYSSGGIEDGCILSDAMVNEDLAWLNAAQRLQPSPEEPTGDQLAEGFDEWIAAHPVYSLGRESREEVDRLVLAALRDSWTGCAAWIASRKAQKAGKL